MSKVMKLIRDLESISFDKLLRDLAGGKQPSENELKLIKDIASRKQLDAGIINVVIHYALLKDEMRLRKETLEKAASVLEKEGVLNVAEALLVIREYYKKPVL